MSKTTTNALSPSCFGSGSQPSVPILHGPYHTSAQRRVVVSPKTGDQVYFGLSHQNVPIFHLQVLQDRGNVPRFSFSRAYSFSNVSHSPSVIFIACLLPCVLTPLYYMIGTYRSKALLLLFSEGKLRFFSYPATVLAASSATTAKRPSVGTCRNSNRPVFLPYATRCFDTDTALWPCRTRL